MSTLRFQQVIPFIALGILFLIAPDEAFARAGGSRAKGLGLLGLILWPLLALYSAIITYYAVRKYRQAKDLLNRISAQDIIWNIDRIKERIEQAYFAIQYAWRDRDPDSAREYMTDRLYLNHKAQIDQMIKRGRRNEMDAISLDSAKIVEVLDYHDDSKDSFTALIEGSMIDKLVNSAGETIDGDDKKRSFQELWKFRRLSHGWALDEIDSEVSISDIRDLDVWSEGHS